MISRTEIDQKAKEFEVNTSNIQRDYVFGWLLCGIFSISNLKDVIFLKGGNALRKGYFSNTRFSSDLDFGIPNDINQQELLSEINLVCEFIHNKAGVSFIPENSRIEEKFAATESPLPDLKVYEVRIYFKDFHGKSDYINLKISMDITRFDRVMLPIQTIPLIHPYSDANEIQCNIRCMKLEEIIATKLKCLLQRQHTADLFDYVYSIKLLGGSLNKEELVDTFINKTIFRRNPHVVKSILVEMPFDYFRGLWTKTLVCAKQIMFDVEDAINMYLNNLEEIFNIYPNNGFREFAFFGPELRNPIMQAGRTQTLLKVIYNNEERLVEPYSLKYLQRKDGSQKEYLYVYNKTGGSGPGIRCFVANNFQLIENTEDKFESRYPIELCKAGEKPENPYLFDPNRPIKPPKITRSIYGVSSTRNSGPKYQYKCTACGKKFTKSTQNSSLGKHKNRFGYQCGGTYGSYIGMKY